MTLYHLNPETGIPGRCEATEGPCPFGTPEAHYESRDDAFAAYEESMKEQEVPPAVQTETLTAPLGAEWRLSDDELRVPAGRWWLGDPGALFGERGDLWDAWVEAADADSDGFSKPVQGVSLEGHPVLGVNTPDGNYTTKDGLTLGSDAGGIVLVPQAYTAELIDDVTVTDQAGIWLDLAQDTTLRYQEGSITLGKLEASSEGAS